MTARTAPSSTRGKTSRFELMFALLVCCVHSRPTDITQKQAQQAARLAALAENPTGAHMPDEGGQGLSRVGGFTVLAPTSWMPRYSDPVAVGPTDKEPS